MIVPNPISPKVTEFSNALSRVRVRGSGHSKKIKELKSKKSSGQNNILDSEARIAMVLAGEDFPAASDIDGQIATEYLNWEATNEAEQSLKPKLAAAKYEAATEVLKGLKPEHDKVVQRIVGPLVEVSKAWIELFDLAQQLKDKDCGWREGVCELVPGLVELFGAPNAHSPLASYLQAAMKAGYISAGSVPRELRV